jgi:CHAT domain-containing protein/tetratricopeptide (TPR) repeat protein
MAMGLFDWLKGKGSQQSGLEPLTDEQYKALFYQLLQGVADGWDGDRLRQVLGDRFADPQFLVWLQGYGKGLSSGTNGDWARLSVRLGEVGCGEIGLMARESGLRALESQKLILDLQPIQTEPLQLEKAQFKQDNDDSANADILALAKELLENFQYEAALNNFRQIIDNGSQNPEVFYGAGLACYRLDLYQDSLAYLNQALALKPLYTLALSRRGLTYQNLNLSEQANKDFEQVLQISPQDYEDWTGRAISLDELGRHEDSLAAYDNALKFKPDFHYAWNGRGIALGNLGRMEEAIASFDHALKIKPDSHEAWYNRGIALGNLGGNKDAIASYDKALKIKSDDHHTWYNRGIALGNLGGNEEAIASYDKALTLTRGKLWQAWINRANAVGQLVKKRMFLLHSLPLEMQHPDLEEPGYQGGLACLREGLKYVERATDPEGWGKLHRWTGLAHYNYARGQKNPAYFWRQAVPCYQTALEALTEDQFPTAHLETLQDLIRVLTALKETETAQTLLREGTALLERLLSQKTGAAQDQFERQFRPAFNELTVALAVQSGDWPTALEIAEQDKNALLRQGLLSNQPAQSPDYGQMQTFVQQQPHTAILYWHLSANALTTFPLTGDQVEAITSDFSQLIALENWIKAWKKDYPTDKKKTSENSTKFPQNSSKSGLIPPNPPSKGGNRAEVQDVSIVFSGKTVIIQNKRESEASNSVINNSSQTSIPSLSREADVNNSIIDNSPQTSTHPLSREADVNNSIIDNSPQTSTPPFLREADVNNSIIDNSSQTSTPPFLRGAGGIKPQNEAEEINATWRDRLHQSLETLKTLLSIPEIETKLAQFPQINRLILIPHRDLHLFPLDSLFTNQYTISYLPSIQVGINLLTHPTNPENRLLSIENPDSIQTNDDGTVTKFPPLTAAEAESELICRMYSNSTRRDKTETTLNEVTVQLTQPYSIMIKMDDDNFNALFSRDLENRNHSYRNIPHNVLHFTGHGYYDFGRPMNSALALSQRDRLTLTQIIKLNLSFYDLACLCACETAIAGNQTITTEYIGIVSAILYAGVAKVISTLWTVESVASAVLMVEFHHRRLTGKPENQALSEAKHWLRTASVAELSHWYQQQMDALPDDHSLRPWLCDRLDELATMKSDSIPYENPYFWAAFTLTGL